MSKYSFINETLSSLALKNKKKYADDRNDSMAHLTDEVRYEAIKEHERLAELNIRELSMYRPFERDMETASRYQQEWWTEKDVSTVCDRFNSSLDVTILRKIGTKNQSWNEMLKYVESLHNGTPIIGTRNDTAEPWGLFFQDNATPQMEGLEELHNNIMFYLAIILFAVSWIMLSIIINYKKAKISNKYVNHGTLVELIWTVTPALILILIAFPSFKLLYLMDEVIDPALVIYGEGHQWYWSYQYPDFTNDDEEFIEFDSYIVPESDLEVGKLRMLEVDNRVIIPELTHTRFIVGGADVIHSYACPSLGIKCDAYPGRLNQSSVYLNREGTYFGQCSEICGILHSSMPIAIQSVSLNKFLYWLYDQIGG